MIKRSTIEQIAKESGVSISTVSRVVNGNVPVSEAKRRRVEDAIQRHDYSPSAMARGLARNQSMTLGIILPDITNPYFAALFLEMERVSLEMGYSTLMFNTLYGGSSHGIASPLSEEEYFRMMIDRQVDGVLITGGQIDLEEVTQGYRQSLSRLAHAVPVVVIGQPIEDTGCLFIQRESGNGVVSAINHLRALGHKRIAFVGGQLGVNVTTTRLNAYKATLQSLQLPLDENLIALSDYYAKDGYRAMQDLLGRGIQFSAIMAMNDMVAAGAQRALEDCGKSVPADVAIVSCDGFFDGEYRVPRLTAIDQQNEYLGRMAILQLVNAINGIMEPLSIDFTPKLIIRESCGAQLPPRSFE
jgi:LacI family transcriptional regulator